MARKTMVGGMGFGGDPGKWLGVLGMLGAAGLLPPEVRRAVRLAILAYGLWGLF